MIKNIRKHAKRRLGLTPQKVVFTIEVRSISNLLPALAHLEKDAILSVCFERGGKMSCSTGVRFDPTSPGNSGTLEFNQKLALVATLYQESSGSFQEKTAKVSTLPLSIHPLPTHANNLPCPPSTLKS